MHLLSEIHPFGGVDASALTTFQPMVPFQQLIARYGVQDSDLLRHFFLAQLELAEELCRRRAQHLVLRDHSHTDFMQGHEPGEPAMLACLEGRETLSLVTIRDPLDAFLSTYRNGWTAAIANNFERYCQRSLKFMDAYEGIPWVRYEDFCTDPQAVMQIICEQLQLAYNPGFMQVFQQFTLSGDSGRRSATIALPERREVPLELQAGIAAAPSYEIFRQRFAYA